jgi:hypothetical protein
MTRAIGKRLLQVLLAYAVAVIAGAIALTLYVVLSGIDEYRATLWSSIFHVSLKLTWILGVFAGFPAACAMAIGECKGISSSRYYLLAGALIGTGFSSLAIPEGKFPWQGPVAGMMIGLIYWRMEGWRAGWSGQDGKNAERRTLASVLLAAFVTFLFIRPYGR